MNQWIVVSFILFSVIVAGLVWYLYFSSQTSSFTVSQLETSARLTVITPNKGYVFVLQPSNGLVTYSSTFTANTIINVQNLIPMTDYTVVLLDSDYKLVGKQSFTTMTQPDIAPQPISAPQPSPRTPGPV